MVLHRDTLRDSASLSTSSRNPVTLPVPSKEMFHLCTGTVGTVDRDSGSDLAGVVIIGRSKFIHGAGKCGKDTLRVELTHLLCVGPSGVAVPQSCDCVRAIAGNCCSNALHVCLVSFMTRSNVSPRASEPWE
ncbi:uncharacterized protein LOC123307045 [Coccinella septempunctata]|uniref:uncharacterized protein LOC123307041 n=1 Tax=Coccinella septempunctata TaxID=41139 RepID=UPI001D080CCC|nr:uncharacterized protein LOC123307041 [Coccinella septempunctata]XP_044745179.1 uncharacterized protein LOC123307042 [Coccinella septempunctata]XP_044745181.1 uncharacterized protein LOC123307044 [Coccinella septempunctata]XP_044745182.1 uncharacterized protein LOC123307045 [Coccinella septempunctata]